MVHNWGMVLEVRSADDSATDVAPAVVPTADEKLSNSEKYERIKTALLELIDKTEDGEPLPPERTLAEDLNVARMTVRKVVDILAGQGYLRRVAGKGTFVTRSRVLRTNGHQPFAQYEAYDTASAQGKVLEMGYEDAGARTGQHLQLAPSAKIIKVVRVSLIAGEPVAIERIHVPVHIFSELRPTDFNTLMLDEFYRRDFGIKLNRSSQVLRVTSINQFESAELGVPLHAPAFFVTTTKTDMDERVFEYTEAVYRGDKYRFLNETTTDGSTDGRLNSGQRIQSNAHFHIT